MAIDFFKKLREKTDQPAAATDDGNEQEPLSVADESGQPEEVVVTDSPAWQEEKKALLTLRERVQLARQAREDKVEALPNLFVFPDGIKLKTQHQLNEGQTHTLHALAAWFNDPTELFYTLKGYAGTGKTTIMKLMVQYMIRKKALMLAAMASDATSFFESGTGDIVLAAPTHRARTVLYNLAGSDIARENCVTVHAMLALRPDFDVDEIDMRKLEFARVENQQSRMPRRGTILLDESSMVSDKLADVLVAEARRLQTKICFIGDDAQLKPVKQNTVSKVFNNKLGSELRQVMRQSGGNPISYMLEDIRNGQHLRYDSYQRFTRLSAKGEGIIFISDSQMAKAWAMEKMLSEEFAQDTNYVRVLCGTNARCNAFNTSLRNVRYGNNPPEYMEGELLTGFSNYGKDEEAMDFSSTLITNSADYIVIIATPKKKKLLDMYLDGWELILVDADDIETPIEERRRKAVFVLARSIGHDVLHLLSSEIIRLQREAQSLKGREFAERRKMAWAKFFAFKESFCTSIDYVEGTYTRIKRTLGYGYAMTVHKSQGGTYDYVLVDEADIDGAFTQDHQLCHQLKYVAFSRASRQVLCLTNQEIVEPTLDF